LELTGTQHTLRSGSLVASTDLATCDHCAITGEAASATRSPSSVRFAEVSEVMVNPIET